MTVIDVDSINRERRLALLTTGDVVPITNLIGEDGEEVEDWSDCVFFVCGEFGFWLVAPNAIFEPAPRSLH